MRPILARGSGHTESAHAWVRIIPLRGAGDAWYKCPVCRLKCRPTAVGAEGSGPQCGHAHTAVAFTTTVGIAVQKGLRVLPFRLPDGPAPQPSGPKRRRQPPSTHSGRALGRLWAAVRSQPTVPGLLPRSAAGSRLRHSGAQGAGPLSAEAAAARAAREGTADLAACVSGRAPAPTGFAEDVAIAAEEDISTVVPVRERNGAFAPDRVRRGQAPGSSARHPVVRHSWRPFTGSPCRVLCAVSAPARSGCTGMGG